MAPLILGLGALIAGAWYAKREHDKKGPPGILTPERKVIFETALNEVKEPAKIRALADAFRQQGLYNEAVILEKRAKLRELSPEIKEQRREIFKKAMASNDPIAVETVALAFEQEGATGAASALREYAQSLRVAYADQAQGYEGGMPQGNAAAPIEA